ncbi:major facilitator superfamily transporter [Colletotrichum orchidophilum]|uniref:Major facilitator superfamily transporter n=1 Tax=Colletotrichum orchidophilum TaxID=1209926 RepID=A0A1G4BB91_9PEZI|nr:major facilitator superfamily transporter [Colletotrichum orchidophilum]OHE98670.1 major facilitator superfamily transporter [Colletotrichum orchidophilum]
MSLGVEVGQLGKPAARPKYAISTSIRTEQQKQPTAATGSHAAWLQFCISGRTTQSYDASAIQLRPTSGSGSRLPGLLLPSSFRFTRQKQLRRPQRARTDYHKFINGTALWQRHYQWPIWVGWTLATIASGLMIVWHVETPAKIWAPTLVLLGLGHGFILNAQNMASHALCDEGDEAIAAAMHAFLRQFGMALGVGVGGSTFQNVMLLKLGDDGLAPAGTHGGTHVISAMLSAAGDVGPPSKIVDAYIYGLRGVYGLYVGVSGLALLMSFLIKSPSMNRSLRSEHTMHTQATGHGSIHGSRS